MKKLLAIVLFTLLALPVLAAKENKDAIIPDQEIGNTKSYTGINYNRQDSEQTGYQRIVNDHSWFNINVQIIKKGALFKGKNIVIGSDEATKEE